MAPERKLKPVFRVLIIVMLTAWAWMGGTGAAIADSRSSLGLNSIAFASGQRGAESNESIYSIPDRLNWGANEGLTERQMHTSAPLHPFRGVVTDFQDSRGYGLKFVDTDSWNVHYVGLGLSHGGCGPDSLLEVGADGVMASVWTGGKNIHYIVPWSDDAYPQYSPWYGTAQSEGSGTRPWLPISLGDSQFDISLLSTTWVEMRLDNHSELYWIGTGEASQREPPIAATDVAGDEYSVGLGVDGGGFDGRYYAFQLLLFEPSCVRNLAFVFDSAGGSHICGWTSINPVAINYRRSVPPPESLQLPGNDALEQVASGCSRHLYVEDLAHTDGTARE